LEEDWFSIIVPNIRLDRLSAFEGLIEFLKEKRLEGLDLGLSVWLEFSDGY